MSTERTNEKRIINVSNRLPVKIGSVNGKMTFQQSEGGLATGLSSVLTDCNNVWIGWPGAVVESAEQQYVTDSLSKLSLSPIFLSQSEINDYYEGFSNETLWPLFHYFPTYSKYSQQCWDSYVAVNQKFADEIIKHAATDDIVWIHDYQLMLVPQMVREALPEVTIGYFQHIPFPNYEIYRALPWKKEIINGLLGADSIGFQTDEDAQHFISTASKLLGLSADYNQLNVNDRTVSVQAFPISIDYDKFRDLAVQEETAKNVEEITSMIKTKLAISIDRLDYSKGIIQRLHAFDLFLQKRPEWRSNITLVHLVVPSRDTVSNYKELKEEMNKLISNINGKYATFSWQPIHHFYQSFKPNMLSAMYKTADLALVTPLRDGMNLVSKEFVASNISMNGVLLLSESAGAAQELTDALLINPNDIHEFADKIHEGLMMSAGEKKSRMAKMQEKIRISNVFVWADTFMKKLKSTVNKQRLKVCTPVSIEVVKKIDRSYAKANKRLLLLDYDGTMVPFFKKAQDALPDAELLGLLRNLASDKRNNVVVISGRDKTTLEQWLGHLQIDMVGEHGAWSKEYGKQWQSFPGLDTSWKDSVKDTFSNYSSITPGASSEEKIFSLAWHYRAADGPLGEKHALDVIKDLKVQLKDMELDIVHGNKVIEVKSNKINKGKAALGVIGRQQYDFIMAIGDDKTDEDMFKVMPENAFSIKVGSNISAATYCQESYLEVRSLLKKLSATATTPTVSKNIMQLIVSKAS